MDFDKTEAALWGSGSLQGNSMEISETGAFSYYIGIGVGGTGHLALVTSARLGCLSRYENHPADSR